MTRTGVFVTPEELSAVQIAQSVSGMWLSGGAPMGDPERDVARLVKKYEMPVDVGLDMANGEFIKP